MLVLVSSLSYTPCASFREESYTPDTILVRSFSALLMQVVLSFFVQM